MNANLLSVIVQPEVRISAHAVLMHIQTVDFLFCGYPQPNGFINIVNRMKAHTPTYAITDTTPRTWIPKNCRRLIPQSANTDPFTTRR